jgi:hypothetical protein
VTELLWTEKPMPVQLDFIVAEREIADHGRAEHVLEAGFTVVSMKDDWSTVYGA